MSDTKKTTAREDLALMQALSAAHSRDDSRTVNRLVTKVWERHGETLKRATRSFPDGEAAAWAALEQMTRRGGVRFFLAAWQSSLEAYAVLIARKSRAVRDAGLLSRKIVRDDAAYASRSTSLDGLIEAHGDHIRGAQTLEALEAERQRDTRAMREGFERIAGPQGEGEETARLTEKQRAGVIRYANLHMDHAVREMATQAEAASSLGVSQQALSQMLDRVRERVEHDAALRTALGRLVDDEQRVEELAAESAERRKPSDAAVESDGVAPETLEEELARARAILGMAAA